MTPEQFNQWQEDNNPKWISEQTEILATCIKDIADFINFDIGQSVKDEKNGDALWYVLTDKDFYGLLVIMCTPYSVFVESSLDEDSEDLDYAIITKPLQYLEHLQNIGLRCLTPDELSEFFDDYDGDDDDE